MKHKLYIQSSLETWNGILELKDKSADNLGIKMISMPRNEP
jgi:hypothetical protein